MKYVVFVDMLGFSALTETHDLNREVFAELQSPGALEFLGSSLESMKANALSERFIRFHHLLAKEVGQIRLSHECSVITFSDCAFFASEDKGAALYFATGVLQQAVKERIPVRAGIAFGDFFVVRIKADFGLTSQDHAIQFLGTGVVRAHAAEHCGLKGLRIFIHPSVTIVPSLDMWANPIPLPETERSNKVKATDELIWLWYAKYDEEYWSAVQDLRDIAPAEMQDHYVATMAAMNRMRLAMNRPSLVPRPNASKS